jgi:hypothetical protein
VMTQSCSTWKRLGLNDRAEKASSCIRTIF